MLHDVLLPDLGLGDVPATIGSWHIKHRGVVIEGDALVEVHATGVLIDIPSPITGTLHRRCALPDEAVTRGQRLAIIRGEKQTR